MQFKVYLFFIITSSIIAESFGRKCYSCSSTPSDYDNDCYNGYANASTTTCNPGENTCFSIVSNRFDGSFEVTRSCNTSAPASAPAVSKDLPWALYTAYCHDDLCNDKTPHLDVPDVKCYVCTSTPTNFNEDCYYGRSSVPTATCEGWCSSVIVNNFNGTFNVNRDCYRYDQSKSNDIPWTKDTTYCNTNLCNNATSHLIEQTSTSISNPTTDSSKASFSIFETQGAWILMETLVFWVIIPLML